MSETISTWAKTHFAQTQLGNKSRTKRLVRIAQALASRPGVPLPQAMPDRKDLKAAYRFFDLPVATHSSLISNHCRIVRERLQSEPGHYFLIQDKTQADFTGRQIEGTGPIGDHKGQGFHAQTTLALRVEAPASPGEPWKPVELLGLLHQRVWVRPADRVPCRKSKENWKQRLKRSDRESLYWGEAFAGLAPLAPGARATYIADCESDLAPVLDGSRLGADMDFIVRIYQSRRLEIGGGSKLLSEALREAPVLGEIKVEVKATQGRPARTAGLEVRSVPRASIARAGAREFGIVELREVDADPGVREPIHWKLATTWDVENLEQCLLVSRAYQLRWIVEEYHKAWKTGTGVEKAQLKTEPRLEALAAVLAVLAARLLSMKLSLGLMGSEEEELRIEGILEAKVGRPEGGWTEREKLRGIAKLGGFLGRKSDGEPGWQSIWRGMIILLDMLEGYRIALDSASKVVPSKPG